MIAAILASAALMATQPSTNSFILCDGSKTEAPACRDLRAQQQSDLSAFSTPNYMIVNASPLTRVITIAGNNSALPKEYYANPAAFCHLGEMVAFFIGGTRPPTVKVYAKEGQLDCIEGHPPKFTPVSKP